MQIKTTGFGFSVGQAVDARQAPWIAPIVFGVFLIVGISFFLGGIYLWNKAEAMRLWPTVQGTVVSAEVATHRSQSRASNGSTKNSITYSAEVIYQYVYNGEEHRSNKMGNMAFSSSDYALADRTVRRYAPGTFLKVYVNDKNPSEAVLTPGAGWGEMLFTGLGLIFALIGVGGLLWMATRKQDTQTGPGSDQLSQI